MPWHGTPYGPWDPLPPRQVAELFAGLSVPWWISGGYAIEAFVGRSIRDHDDIDIGILRADHLRVREAFADWDFHAADPPGTLRPWPLGESLSQSVHDIWCRPTADAPWQMQLMLNEHDRHRWLFRREPAISRDMATLTFLRDGIPYLVPEVQLLFKSKSPRPKDELDFEAAEALLDQDRRRWLAHAIAKCSPRHPWLSRLFSEGLP